LPEVCVHGITSLTQLNHRVPTVSFTHRSRTPRQIAEQLAERNAVCEFKKIVEYMTGLNPDSVSEADKTTTGSARCLALLYEGIDPIEKVRTVLGSTDPSKAEPGTVRSDFGRDLMRNGAHASDSPESATRERKIVGLASDSETGTCDIQKIIAEYLG